MQVQVQVAPTPREQRTLPCHIRSTTVPSPSPHPNPQSKHSIPGLSSQRGALNALEEERQRQKDEKEGTVDPVEKAKRLELRMSYCGHLYDAINAKGDKYKWEFLCGMWRRGCARCLLERVIKFKNRGERILHTLGDRIRVRQLSADEFKALREDLPTDAYWRVPTEEEDEDDKGNEDNEEDTVEGAIILYDADVLDLPGNLDYEDLDWEDLCKTPGRRRASGKLGLPPPPPEPEEFDPLDRDDLMDLLADGVEPITVPLTITVRLPHTMCYLGPDCPFTKDELWEAAQYQTCDLDPAYDIQEIEAATRQRMDVYKKLIIQHGGRVVHSIRHKKVIKLNTYDRWSLQIKLADYAKYDEIVNTTTPGNPPKSPEAG